MLPTIGNKTMTNENNVQPKLGDIVRSMVPYLFSGKPGIDGAVAVEQTSSGQKFAIYTPPGYGSDRTSFPVLYHLHGAGMLWSWVQKELHWIAAAHEQSVKHDKTKPLVIVSPYDASKFSMWTS